MKQFISALAQEFVNFRYLKDFYPKVPGAKVKASVFVGPQIKKTLECTEFHKKFTEMEF